MFVRLEKPIDFEAIDEIPVDIVFLLLMPDSAGKDHLNVLACVARRLREPEVLRDMKSAPDADRLYLSLVGSPP
jgi:PTS system nitrogen regulatory IIA component